MGKKMYPEWFAVQKELERALAPKYQKYGRETGYGGPNAGAASLLWWQFKDKLAKLSDAERAVSDANFQLEYLEHAIREIMRLVDAPHTYWCIENNDEQPTRWWTGTGFDSDIAKAVRFVSRESAQTTRGLTETLFGCCVTDHIDMDD